MIEKEQVRKFVAEGLTGTDMFLVDVVVGNDNAVRVTIDKMDGISLDACVEMNRFLKEKLDLLEEDYSLEVSSPGLGSPFRVKQQYHKNIGREVEVVLKNGGRVTGKLNAVEEGAILMEPSQKRSGRGRNENAVQELKIDFNEIKATKAVVSFK
ncbi:MAG: ribosome assembly cofactor RimP [Bacteroidales bacterium]|nr:ribosome assembly cofactor RimP [Bacteroidales bacterium]